MSNYLFSEQAGKSYYYNSISGFLQDDPNAILGNLTNFAAKYGFDTVRDQTNAWQNQIFTLQAKLREGGCKGDVIFEYDIVRMGKRIDVVLLIKHMVFSLEFKNGAKAFLARDAEQAEDYALNLKNFHKESENLYVCPILVATEAREEANIVGAYPDGQIFLQKATKDSLMSCIENVYKQFGSDEELDFGKWYNSPYCPTPTIIEGAVTAYREHTVARITNSEAGQKGIDACEKKISEIIQNTKKKNGKAIIFVTGVPGAGKTLVGLDLVAANLDSANRKYSVYLSGNGPLVKVLRKALIGNTIEHLKAKLRSEGKPFTRKERLEMAGNIESFIQDAYNYRKLYSPVSDDIPPENVVVFDEAQRCWNNEKLKDWTRRKFMVSIDMSEPEYFLRSMGRRKDWTVLICLVGLGQDIYDGEAGINEWFKSAIEKCGDWDLYYSPELFAQIEDSITDRQMILDCPRAHQIDRLHLSTAIRSFKCKRQSDFVDMLLANKPGEAKKIYEEIKDQFPIFVTRDFNLAKKVTRDRVRGSQRSGVIACSSAQRLKPEGVFVPTEIDVENWFLANKNDLRSSNALEVVASEFKVQGLEIDHSIVCWDADLRRSKGGWDYYNFRGTKWNHRNQPIQQRYLLNAYRVLLTRARQSMIIFVPRGDMIEIDETRKPEYYEDIYKYLHDECGIVELPSD